MKWFGFCLLFIFGVILAQFQRNADADANTLNVEKQTMFLLEHVFILKKHVLFFRRRWHQIIPRQPSPTPALASLFLGWRGVTLSPRRRSSTRKALTPTVDSLTFWIQKYIYFPIFLDYKTFFKKINRLQFA